MDDNEQPIESASSPDQASTQKGLPWGDQTLDLSNQGFKWYLRISGTPSIWIVQGLVALLEVLLPAPGSWIEFGVWPDERGWYWTVGLYASTLIFAVLGVGLTGDLYLDALPRPEAPRKNPASYIPFFLPSYFLMFTLGPWLKQEYSWNTDTLIAVAIFGPLVLLLVGGTLSSLNLERTVKKTRICPIHWVGLFFLLLSAATEWHLIAGTLTAMFGGPVPWADILPIFRPEDFDSLLIFITVTAVYSFGAVLFASWFFENILPALGLVLDRATIGEDPEVEYWRIGLNFVILTWVNLGLKLFVWH